MHQTACTLLVHELEPLEPLLFKLRLRHGQDANISHRQWQSSGTQTYSEVFRGTARRWYLQRRLAPRCELGRAAGLPLIKLGPLLFKQLLEQRLVGGHLPKDTKRGAISSMCEAI
jgi:hypothetical protein